MCGLVGIVDLRGERPVEERVLQRMNDLQHHRGPDDDGLHMEPGVGLGHRRLAIIDLSGGRQPLYNEDGSVVVVYNGEIYNFAELMAELEALGHTFRTRCDTEVIVHAWESWGEDCVDRFRGMFAFALWDRSRRTLLLARDRLGIKPLYYAHLPDGRIAFVSELKSLEAVEGLSREVDPQAVEDYFALGYVPEPKSIFKSVNKLPAGHTLTLERGAPMRSPRRYWDVDLRRREPLGEAEAIAGLNERIDDAVRVRMIAEVPLGAFLSGGIDSSAIVAAMSRVAVEPVVTCSIGFGSRDFDESRYAGEVARLLGTRHHLETVDPDDYGLLDSLADVYDEPFADASAIPTYRVCELARQRVTVALSGDGGDENLAGYRRYRLHMNEDRVRGMLPLGLRRAVFGPLGRIYPKADWAPRVLRARATFQGLARDSVDAYFASVSVTREEVRQRMLSGDLRGALGGYSAGEVFRQHARSAPVDPGDGLSLVQYLDLKTYLVDDILTKVDRASMAHSLEVRVPLLDHPLVEWIGGLSSEHKLNGGEGKSLLKKSLATSLPREIIHRRKQGFSVPIVEWFRGPLRERVRETVLGETLRSTGLFDQAYLHKMVARHESGASDYSRPLWSLLMFEAFCRRWSV